MMVEGKGKPGFVNGTGHITLSDKDEDKTLMKYEGDMQLGGRLAQRLSRVIRLHGWDRGKTGGLTVRELEILKEVARGRTDDEIAAQFVVAPGTIKTHIRRILRKISARNRAQAGAYVLRNGLIK